MTLSEIGEARVRGYLYVLERSLHSSLPPAVVTDAVREVESHIRDRVAETNPLPDARRARLPGARFRLPRAHAERGARVVPLDPN